jgi:hypothetical protein
MYEEDHIQELLDSGLVGTSTNAVSMICDTGFIGVFI